MTKRTEEELAVLKVTLEEKKTAEVAEAKRQTERRALLKATLEAKIREQEKGTNELNAELESLREQQEKDKGKYGD